MFFSRFSHGVRSAASFLLFAISVLACSHSLAAPGALEQSSLLQIPGGDNNAITMTIEPDGKILAAGYAYFGTKQFAITRYNADGSVDTSFGNNGTRLEWLGPGNAEPHGIAVQSTGQIVVGGFAVSDMSRFGLARFNSDGSLDTTFGGGGVVTTISTGSAALAMALQSDDKIILGGWSIVGGKKVFTLARYDANSPTLDTTFGSGGVAAASAASTDQQINSIAIQSDDKIVAAGDDGNGGMLVRRYNADGSLDTSFGTGGTFATSSMAGGRALAILSNGDILVAGEVPGIGAFEVTRLTSSGALDTSFGVNGFAQQGNGSSAGHANGMSVQSNGQIVVAGTGATSSGPAVAIARFNADGSNDTGFGHSGVIIQQFTTASDEGNALAILGSGEIVVAGTAGTNSAHDSLLAGFTATGLDTGFGTSGSTVVDVGSEQSAGLASALQSDGKLVVAGFDHPVPTVPSILSGLVARYNADGTLDTTFGTAGMKETAGDKLQAVAIQSDGKIVVAGYAEGTFNGNPADHIVVGRLNPDGSVDTTFGGGFPTITADGPTEEISSIAIQSDGKIVLAGVGQLTGGFTDALFVRMNPDGTLDSSFGGTGKVRVAMSTGNDEVNAIAIQGDGKIVGAGFGDVSGSQDSVMLTRLNTDGTVDTSFGTSGVATTSVGTTTSHANAIALQSDGKIVIGGQWFNPTATNDDFLVARYLTSGALDTSFGSNGTVTTDMGNHNRLFAVMILANGKIVGAGHRADGFALAQYLPSGALDTTFGSGGTVYQPINAGADIAYSIVLRPDGKYWVSGDGTNLLAAAVFTGDGGATPAKANPSVGIASSANPSTQGQSVTFTANVSGSAGTPTGTVTFLDGSSAIGGCSAVALSGGVATCATSTLASGTHSVTASYSGDANYNAGTSSALSQAVQGSTTTALAYSPASVDFGGESMGTTSQPKTITVTNNGTGTVTITGISASTQFSQSNDCSSLAPGASCTIAVTFTPSAAAGPVNTTVAVSGTVTVTSSASGSPDSLPLSGSAEKSLVTHFYEAILGRTPDAGGKSYWEDQANSTVNLGADVNEVWYAMGSQFFFSAEYLALARDNTGFVTDLYNAFFNRPPDASGLSYWVGQLDSGMPREVVLVSFELSPEFTSFCQGIFGNTAARAEVNVVMDFYRGLLARLPDSGGFNFWVGQFRTAQCQGASAVYSQVESISSQFADGTEYTNRNRSNAQYVGDLYNAFLRRGGDEQGVQFWIQQLDSGAQTRDQVRRQFVASPEFNSRVNAIVNQGCMQ